MMYSVSSGIPMLDLNDFYDRNDEPNFVAALGQAYENIGFVAIKNHGIDDELLNRFYKVVADFFNLPTAVKQQYEDQNGGQRGYTSFGKEHAKNSAAGDLKEFWHFGQYMDDAVADDPLHQFYPANKYVKELEEFNTLGKEIYQKLETSGKLLLRAIALFLGLEVNYFDDKIYLGNSILRPIHYPPIINEPNDSVRAGEHEDINLITLLVGASADGLEVLNKQNQWVAVTKVEDCIVVNVGDMLQRLTNNRLKSTTHRVVNPPKEKWGNARYSIPFFLHPRPEVNLDCLASCITEENPKQYEPITAIDYLNERLKEIGLKK